MTEPSCIIRGKSAAQFWQTVAELEADEKKAREQRWLRGDMAHDELSSLSACVLLAQPRSENQEIGNLSLSASQARNIAKRYKADLPLCVYASGSRRTDAEIITTSRAYSPSGIVRLQGDVFVATPAQCLADLSDKLSTVEALLLAYEYCGLFVKTANGELKECEPRCTAEELLYTAQQFEGCRGVRTLRFVCRFVLPRSRSPRESALAIILTLPHSFGGYALPVPWLNAAVSLSDTAASIWGSSGCEVDGCWPEAKVAYEYQSNEFHEARIDRDSIKRLALEADGWRVISITNAQLKKEKQMDVVAAQIAKELGIRLNPRGKGYRVAQRKLFKGVTR